MLNNITLQGRFTAEPIGKMTKNNTPVVSFVLACERDFQKVTDFCSCTAWRQTAEFIGNNFHKGQMAVVNGRLQNKDWEDRDGNKRTTAEIVVDRIYFCEKKQQFEELPDDEDVPF